MFLGSKGVPGTDAQWAHAWEMYTTRLTDEQTDILPEGFIQFMKEKGIDVLTEEPDAEQLH